MHTEHLQNVRLTRVIAGWLVAIAISSLLVFMLLAAGFLDGDSGDSWWSALVVLIGFWAGGFFAGFRAMQAAILHGIAIGLTSLIVWFVLNVAATLFVPDFRWASLTPRLAIGLLLAQMTAAVIGALMGYNTATRGRPSLEEHPPESTANGE